MCDQCADCSVWQRGLGQSVLAHVVALMFLYARTSATCFHFVTTYITWIRHTRTKYNHPVRPLQRQSEFGLCSSLIKWQLSLNHKHGLNYFSDHYIEHSVCQRKCLIHWLWLLSFWGLLVLWAHGMMWCCRGEGRNNGDCRLCVPVLWLQLCPLKVVLHKSAFLLTTAPATLRGTLLLKMGLSLCFNFISFLKWQGFLMWRHNLGEIKLEVAKGSSQTERDFSIKRYAVTIPMGIVIEYGFLMTFESHFS